MPAWVEKLLTLQRPILIKGKGRLLDPLVPRSGIRHVPTFKNVYMTLDLSNAIHRQIYIGCFEREPTRWVRGLLPRGGTFLDVGANVGYYTLLSASLVGKEGKVLAVEPNPRVFSNLVDHVQANRLSCANVFQMALSRKRGRLDLYLPPMDHRDYNVTAIPQGGWEIVEVPSQPLDAFLTEQMITRVDVMKMDVEGHEPSIVAGGSELLRRGVVKALICEVNGPYLVKVESSPKALIDQLANVGFAPASYSGSRAIPTPVESWDTSPTGNYDRLFVWQG